MNLGELVKDLYEQRQTRNPRYQSKYPKIPSPEMDFLPVEEKICIMMQMSL